MAGYDWQPDAPGGLRGRYWREVMMSEATSLLPLDVGFDPKVHGMAIDLSTIDGNRVRFEGKDDHVVEVEGTKSEIATALIEAGFGPVVVEHAPNGREIRMVRSGRFEVQPWNDNYWITTETLEAAKDAYHNPREYR